MDQGVCMRRGAAEVVCTCFWLSPLGGAKFHGSLAIAACTSSCMGRCRHAHHVFPCEAVYKAWAHQVTASMHVQRLHTSARRAASRAQRTEMLQYPKACLEVDTAGHERGGGIPIRIGILIRIGTL